MPHPAHPVFAKGHVALITGGGSGIGLGVAKLAHSHGMRIALVDVDAAALAGARAHLGGGAHVETYVADVSQVAAWTELRGKVDARFGNVHFLHLNAGIGAKGGWEDTEYFRKIMDTNLFGVIHGISAFLPSVQAAAVSAATAIVITGSKQGITNPPGNAAYNASKAAVKTLAEHLSYDLRHTSTTVHLLVPGWTFTSMTARGGATDNMKPDGAWWPQQVAGYLEQKIADGEFYIICPDNDVTEDTDRRRMLWAAGDVVYGRPPLSRWREDWKDKAKEGIEKTKI